MAIGTVTRLARHLCPNCPGSKRFASLPELLEHLVMEHPEAE